MYFLTCKESVSFLNWTWRGFYNLQVLERFRKQNCNLLVATSVVEEGMDVPKCNLVVRFDFPSCYRSYVQSKGRARARKSLYILLVSREECGEKNSMLSNYRNVEKVKDWPLSCKPIRRIAAAEWREVPELCYAKCYVVVGNQSG